jgi:hypothetical protein
LDSMAKDRQAKALRFVNLLRLRFSSGLAEEQIAAEMGFRSAAILHRQLQADGSPVCGVCGLLYPEPDHREEHKDRRKKRQPGVGGGHRVKLPDAGAAEGLFREALGELNQYLYFVDMEESWLEGNLEEDGFKGKQFITHSVDRDSVEVARREDYKRRGDPTEAAWKELCERYGADPQSEEIVVSVGSAAPGGVSRTPSTFLTALVAAYELAALPLERLVEALHPDPDSTDWGVVCQRRPVAQDGGAPRGPRARRSATTASMSSTSNPIWVNAPVAAPVERKTWNSPAAHR